VTEGGGKRDQAQRHRPPDVHDDHHRAAAQTVHPDPGEKPDDQPRPVLRGIQQRHLDRRGMERQDRDECQCEAADAAAKERDCLPGPQLQEVGVPPQPGETGA